MAFLPRATYFVPSGTCTAPVQNLHKIVQKAGFWGWHAASKSTFSKAAEESSCCRCLGMYSSPNPAAALGASESAFPLRLSRYPFTRSNGIHSKALGQRRSAGWKSILYLILGQVCRQAGQGMGTRLLGFSLDCTGSCVLAVIYEWERVPYSMQEKAFRVVHASRCIWSLKGHMDIGMPNIPKTRGLVNSIKFSLWKHQPWRGDIHVCNNPCSSIEGWDSLQMLQAPIQSLSWR